MRVGILGSGLMGGKLGMIFARTGHEVVFSYARSEQKLKTLESRPPSQFSKLDSFACGRGRSTENSTSFIIGVQNLVQDGGDI